MRSCLRLALAAAGMAVLSSGCGLIEGYRQCADVDPIREARLPTHLAETGLFADVASGTLAPGVRTYRPAFELWSDGATKRRWISLPAGAQIDTRDMDEWAFPVGTKLWKEFTRDGVRVETRLLARTGPGADGWAAVAYLWNADGTDAVAVPDGVQNARGTPHDVPAASECWGCHGGRASRVLGFSAVQLSRPAEPGSVGLEELVANDSLSVPPTELRPVPASDATKAIGYLHANCSHCHNQRRPLRSHDGFRCFDPEKTFDLSLRWSDLAAGRQPTAYLSAVGSVIKRGDPGDSELMARISSRDRFPPSMPPLGTERVDDDAVRSLSRWIQGL